MVAKIPKPISIVFLLTVGIALSLSQNLGTDPDGTHQFGQRTNNDRLLYKVSNPVGNSGFFSFQFGGTDSGPSITFVEVAVNDIFNQTHAYISSGGIGEKSIVVVLSVLHKKEFSYNASIYGV